MLDDFWKDNDNIDAILVSEGCNMRYISGFCGATGYLFLTEKRKVLMTDSRYTTQARGEAYDYEILEVGVGRGYGHILGELVREEKVHRLLFEDSHMVYADVRKLQEKCPGVAWIPAEDKLGRLRMIKRSEELAFIERAEAIGDEAFGRILQDIRPGVTELEIAARLEFYMKEGGAAGTSFDTIVASGVHSAMPHAVPSEKKIEKGDFVTMDFGCIYQGYCSDMTRTVVVGKADKKQRDIYETVLKAQLAALEVIGPGMQGDQVDEAARKIIREAGYGDYFGHGLGHSVGLFIHEEPRLSVTCQEVLRPGMTETVEPGIYLPGFGGVRIEDLVCITEEGCRNFTHSPKELLEL